MRLYWFSVVILSIWIIKLFLSIDGFSCKDPRRPAILVVFGQWWRLLSFVKFFYDYWGVFCILFYVSNSCVGILDLSFAIIFGCADHLGQVIYASRYLSLFSEGFEIFLLFTSNSSSYCTPSTNCPWCNFRQESSLLKVDVNFSSFSKSLISCYINILADLLVKPVKFDPQASLQGWRSIFFSLNFGEAPYPKTNFYLW